MKQARERVLALFLIFLLAFPFGTVLGTEEQWTEERIEEIRGDVGGFETLMSAVALTIGDFAQDYLTKIFQQEITIDMLIYNKVEMLDANFFRVVNNPNHTSAGVILKKAINTWYSYLKSIAIVVMLICLIGAGMRMLMNTPEQKAGAYGSIKRVFFGFVLLFFFPYVMKYGINLNEALVRYIAGDSYTNDVLIASPITQKSDLAPSEIEFRSPKYVTSVNSSVEPGSVEAAILYMERADEYQQSVDLMRLMHAFASVTYKFVYVILWYILLIQTYILTIIYIKRFLMIAFLIAVYPIVVMVYVVEGIIQNGKSAFNSWTKNFFAYVFLQSFHAIMFGIIREVIIHQVRNQISVDAKELNVILMIVAISFLFSGEKILKRFFKDSLDTSNERKGLKEIFGAPKRMWKQMRGK